MSIGRLALFFPLVFASARKDYPIRMKSSRRHFLKTTGLICGATALPAWVFEMEAAEAAVIDKNALADIAMSRGKQLGVSYADIRINRYRYESIYTREQQVQNVSRTQSFGCGVRVLFKGRGGFPLVMM